MQCKYNLLKFLYQMGYDYDYACEPRQRHLEKLKSLPKHTPLKSQTPAAHSIKGSVTPPLHHSKDTSSLVSSFNTPHDTQPVSSKSHLFQTPTSPIFSRLSQPQEIDLSMARTKIIAHQNDHPAFQARTLSDLKNAIHAFEGCSLKMTAKNTVFCDGNPEADIMLIGEAPGADEDEQGKPFVGRCGQLLDKMMMAIGLDRTVVYITNIVPWRPPANRTPSTQEIASCLPFVEQHIYLKRPKFLLLLGGVATKAILNNASGIMRLRGQWHDYKPPMADENYPNISVLPTFHPAFLLRSPGQKVYAWEDLKMLKAALDTQTEKT